MRIVYGYDPQFTYFKDTDILVEPRKCVLDKLPTSQTQFRSIVKKCLIPDNEYKEITLSTVLTPTGVYHYTGCSTYITHTAKKEKVYTTSLSNIIDSYGLDSAELVVLINIDNINDIIKSCRRLSYVSFFPESTLSNDATPLSQPPTHPIPFLPPPQKAGVNIFVYGKDVPTFVKEIARKTNSTITSSNNPIFHNATIEMLNMCDDLSRPCIFVDAKRSDATQLKHMLNTAMDTDWPESYTFYATSMKHTWFVHPETITYIKDEISSESFNIYMKETQSLRKGLFPMVSKSYFFYYFEARCEFKFLNT
jgi:hypothetical protein